KSACSSTSCSTTPKRAPPKRRSSSSAGTGSAAAEAGSSRPPATAWVAALDVSAAPSALASWVKLYTHQSLARERVGSRAGGTSPAASAGSQDSAGGGTVPSRTMAPGRAAASCPGSDTIGQSAVLSLL